MSETEKSPEKLAEQFTHTIELIGGVVPNRDVEIVDEEENRFLVGVTEGEQSVPFASIIRETVEELLEQSRVTHSYKSYLREEIEERLTSTSIRFAETIWFKGSALPILRRAGIALDYKEVEYSFIEEPDPSDPSVVYKSLVSTLVDKPPLLGIFDPDVDALKILERDIIRYEFEQLGWLRGSPEEAARRQKLNDWTTNYFSHYGDIFPIEQQGNYEHPVIRQLWLESQPL